MYVYVHIVNVKSPRNDARNQIITVDAKEFAVSVCRRFVEFMVHVDRFQCIELECMRWKSISLDGTHNM